MNTEIGKYLTQREIDYIIQLREQNLAYMLSVFREIIESLEKRIDEAEKRIVETKD